MEEHLFYLQRLCRICGEILSGRVTYLVSDHLEELTELYKVHFAGDTSGKEPSSFCNTCYSRVKNSSKFTPKVWFPHEGPDCTTCCHYNMKKKGGRPKKIKNRGGRPKQQVEVSPKTMTLTEIMMNLSPSKPVHPELEKCVSAVLSIKMKQSILPNNTVQLPTKGPQVKFYKIIIINKRDMCQKPSFLNIYIYIYHQI